MQHVTCYMLLWTVNYRGGGNSVRGFFRRGKFRMGKIPHLSKKSRGKFRTSQIFSALEARGILGLRSPKDPGRRQ